MSNLFIVVLFYIYDLCKIDILSINAKNAKYDSDKDLISLSLNGYEYIEFCNRVYVRIKDDNGEYRYSKYTSMYIFFKEIEKIDETTERNISLWLEFKYRRLMRKTVYVDGHMTPMTYNVSMSKLPTAHKFDEYLIWHRNIDGIIKIYGSAKSILTMSKLHDELDKILYGVK